ncbi:MAG: hypothetical protein ACJAUT_000957 [Cellvibrionaceae bacterium]|jgi:hypothetical protein
MKTKSESFEVITGIFLLSYRPYSGNELGVFRSHTLYRWSGRESSAWSLYALLAFAYSGNGGVQFIASSRLFD